MNKENEITLEQKVKKGVIYIAETIVNNLIKIGKTKTDNFEARMYLLERNGYCNVTGLKRRFAIEVENYDDKEILIHKIFGKSRIEGTELFALDVDTAIQLLSSFEGNVIYPREEKNQIFEEATENNKSKRIPDGKYTFTRQRQGCNTSIDAKVEISEGNWKLLKGSYVGTDIAENMTPKVIISRSLMKFDSNGELLEDLDLGHCTPSFAACVVLGHNANGWTSWKNENGKFVDIYRQNEERNAEE